MRRAAGVLCGIAILLAACVKPDTFNPYNAPERSELDRLQTIVNERPDLETVAQQLADLDKTIRATIAKYAPQSQFSTIPLDHQTSGCVDPFGHNIGQYYATDLFAGSPAPSADQWRQISAALQPVFGQAGFRPVDGMPGEPPRPLGSANDSQTRDDGARIELKNATDGSPLTYSYDTGCHLPAAWRTAPPPAQLRPGNDEEVHYPYLYGPPGGRTAPAQ